MSQVLAKILRIFETEIPCPTAFGWFHLTFCALVVIGTVWICLRFRNADDKTFRKIMAIYWIVILVLEVYKQIVYSFEPTDTGIVFHYNWTFFPFQFCSTPYFVLPILIFAKDGFWRRSAGCFMATFSFAGAVSCYLFPDGVFTVLAGIDFQTMIHHGLQIVIGVFCAVYDRKRFSFKYVLGAIGMFFAFCAIALGLNEWYAAKIHAPEVFNMFFISRHYPCTLVFLDGIYRKVSYAAFLGIYLGAFSALAVAASGLENGLIKLVSMRKPKKT